MTPGALAATVLGRNLRPLIEFALQLPLESYQIKPPLPYQYPCLNRVVTAHRCYNSWQIVAHSSAF